MQMEYKDHEALFQTNYFGVVSACSAMLSLSLTPLMLLILRTTCSPCFLEAQKEFEIC